MQSNIAIEERAAVPPSSAVAHSGAVARRRYPSIDRRPGLDRETLHREYLSRNRPVVIPSTDSVWRSNWQPTALRAKYGHHAIDAEGTEVYVGERTRVTTPLATLIDAIVAGDRRLRWKCLEFLSAIPAMREDLGASPPPFDALLPLETRTTRRALWLAPRGTMSSLHHDGNSDNINCQIHGKKLFLLVPPARLDHLYIYGSAQSPINPFVPELERFPKFMGAAAVEATLEPGDVLFIPKYWWHCVYAIEPSVNLNTWFSWTDELRPWRVLDGAPLFARACMTLAAEMKKRELFGLAKVTRNIWYAIYERVVSPLPPQPRGELFDP